MLSIIRKALCHLSEYSQVRVIGHREHYTKIKAKGHESYLGGFMIWLRSDHRVYISRLEKEEHAKVSNFSKQ